MKSASVFVSSTCYDLRQVRVDLREFLTSLGLDPVLSEFASFPVDPDASTLDNCLKAVEQRADLFVLIIGGRYGSAPRGSSITNLEFLTARAKGIPVYTFVDRRVLDAYPIWKVNPDADFGSVVDTPKVFEFVGSIRDQGERWVFSFETAQDICSTLRTQFSYLFAEAIQLRQRVYGKETIPASLRNLQGELLRILIERPRGWEYLLFAEAFQIQIAGSRDLRIDWATGIAFGTDNYVNVLELCRCVKSKNNEAARLAGNAVLLFETALPEAFGPPGTPGDPEAICYVALRMGEVYREILKWKLEFGRITVAHEANRLKFLLSCQCDNIVQEIEEFARTSLPAIKDALAHAVTGEKRQLKLLLKLTAPDMGEMQRELERLTNLIERRMLDPNE